MPGGDGNALLLNRTNPAGLIYNVVDPGSTTNLTLTFGSVEFWFAPQWSSTNAGGTGPGCLAPLIQVGHFSTNASYGLWSLSLDPQGMNIAFIAQDGNGNEADFLVASICWTNNQWHCVDLTYSPSNSALYIDGLLVTNGTGVTCLPPPQVVAQGFSIGGSP